MIYKDNTLYGSEIVFDYYVEILSRGNLSEADIDSKTAEILKKLGWVEYTEFRQRKTNIPEIDNHLKSKSGTNRKGYADFYLLINDKLKVIIDNKNPNESVEQGINDAIFYATSLREKLYDVRIVLSYNGKKCQLRVFDSMQGIWVPFCIGGLAIDSFPSKELVEIIYRYKNINNIIITKDYGAINIKRIIQGLKTIYRNIPHIQNDNQKTIDFTIAFIALKSILEKHGSDLGKNWSDLDVASQKTLKEKIKTYADDIVENLANGYGEIFYIKEDPKGKIKAFDFLQVINQFPNILPEGEEGYLIKIFRKINELPQLYSSNIDLFGEVYQSLMDKYTRKIFGQFFTPRHLIKTLVRLFYEGEEYNIVGDISGNKSIKPKTICDPACGTGGFLTESFKYFHSRLADVDTIDLAKKSIYGFDIYPANAVRSRINMYLAGDGFSKIDSIDSLKNLDGGKIQFDYIVTNPPFGDGDYVVDGDIMNSKRKEVNFLIKITKLLKPNGKALIIVPDGILEAPTLSPLREWVIKNCMIEKIIGLPKYEFAPYTHEKTYILFLKKRPIPIIELNDVKTERIWMYIMDNDGYANSDKRFRTGKKDKNGRWLHDELSLWSDEKGASRPSIIEGSWKKKAQPIDEKYYDLWGGELEGLKYGYVNLSNIFLESYVVYPTVSKSNIIKLLQTEIKQNKPVNASDLFGDGGDEAGSTIKSIYEKILLGKQIIYNNFEDKFFDQNNPKKIRLLNLLPEKYLNAKKIDTMDFLEFVSENKSLVEAIKKEMEKFREILGGLEQ